MSGWAPRVRIGIGLVTAEVPPNSQRTAADEYSGTLRIAERAEQHGSLRVRPEVACRARGHARAYRSALRLAVGCLGSLAVRDPALFALQWASLDAVSGGRTLLAVCNGLQKKDAASEREGRNFGGVPDRQRAARLEEYIGLLRQLWTGHPIDFDGRFAHYEGIQILPRPVQEPCPIWISANPPAGPAATRVLRRVATLSDGLLTNQSAPGYIAATRAVLDGELRAAGRDPGSFPVAAYHSINIGPDREECLGEARRFFDKYYGEGVFGRETAQAMTATGTVKECVEQLRAVRDEGASHIALRLASWRPREQLDLLVGKVLPAFLAA